MDDVPLTTTADLAPGTMKAADAVDQESDWPASASWRWRWRGSSTERAHRSGASVWRRLLPEPVAKGSLSP